MSAAEALHILTQLWEARHAAMREVLLSRGCANCLKVKVESLQAETDALAAALDCLRNTAAGGVR